LRRDGVSEERERERVRSKWVISSLSEKTVT